MRWNIVRGVAALAAVAVSVSLSGCGSGGSGSKGNSNGNSKLTVVEPYATPRLGSSGDILYATSQQQGYFAKENLQIKVAYADGSTAALQALASGSGDIAAASLSEALKAKAKGLPLKVLAASVINYPWKIATVPGSPIQQPSDLKGKTIGIISLASESYTFAQNYVKEAGLQQSDVKTIEVGTGAAATQALTSGKVDALALYDSVYQQLEGQGAKFSFLKNPSLFDNVVSIAMVTTEKSLSSNRKAIEAYLRAYNKGVLFGTVNPDAAVLDSFKQYPDFLTGTTAAAALPKAKASFVAYMVTATPDMDYTKWPDGWQNITSSQWDATNRYVQNAGMLKSAVPQKSMYDGSLNKAADSFDKAAVVSEAKSAPRSAQ